VGGAQRFSAESWVKLDADHAQKSARCAAAAAWELNKWSEMESYTSPLRAETVDSNFYSAVSPYRGASSASAQGSH